MPKFIACPIQVYLDSSDFSNMSIPQRTHEADSVRHFLLENVRCGEIEIRFSAAHLMEAAATEQQYLNCSRERFLLMRELCGERCFIDPFSLMRNEASDTTTKVQEYPGRDDGIWLPRLENINMDIPDLKATLLEQLDQAPINRSQRRHLTARLIGKDGGLSQQALQMLSVQPQELIETLSEKYPLNKEGIRIVLDVFTGKLPRDKLDQQFRRLLADLARFHEWNEKSWEQIGPMMGWLRVQGRRFEDLVNEQRRIFEELRARTGAAALDQSTVRELESRGRNRLNLSISAAIRQGQASERSSAIKSRLGSDVFCAVLTSVAMDSIFRAGNPRKPKSSDFGDALHAVYLPYVDVFRADAYMASLMNRIQERGQATIVSNFAKLPEAINRKIATRGSQAVRR